MSADLHPVVVTDRIVSSVEPCPMRPLIQELQQALAKTPDSKHLAILKGVTDLFLDGAATYSQEHIAIFDDIIGHLIEKIERPAVIELSRKLATVSNAPAGVIARLSRDNNIAVAGPILERSDALTDETLVEIANTKGQHHLSAIASRTRISEAVTSALIDRGNANVTLNVARNEGASLSDVGFVKIADIMGGPTNEPISGWENKMRRSRRGSGDDALGRRASFAVSSTF